MYAAARFSDLPELRDLRDIFQQKYGTCFEAFVNQKVSALYAEKVLVITAAMLTYNRLCLIASLLRN